MAPHHDPGVHAETDGHATTTINNPLHEEKTSNNRQEGYEETPKKKSSKLDGFKDSAAAFGNKTLSGAKSLASGGIEIGMPPPANRDPNAVTGEWSTPIFACLDDWNTLLYVHCCFNWAALFHSRDMGQIGSLWCGLATCSICSGANRAADRWRLMKKYGIKEEWLSTKIIFWACPQLALMQEMREVKMRGGYEPLRRDLTTPIRELAGGY